MLEMFLPFDFVYRSMKSKGVNVGCVGLAQVVLMALHSTGKHFWVVVVVSSLSHDFEPQKEFKLT